ncbi:MAG: hypothetical protein GX760_03335 [Erysipelothrix sp.]|nr:hypothetical protein [Erysipelothrix sp.]
MDRENTLKEAKELLESLKVLDASLDSYMKRVDSIILDLEDKIYGEKQLTATDIEVIKKEVVEEHIEAVLDSEHPNAVVEEVKKKKRFTWLKALFLLISLLSLTLSVVATTLSNKRLFTFNDTHYILYPGRNAVPNIPEDSLVTVDVNAEIKKDDFVAYEINHEIIRINLVGAITEDNYRLVNPGSLTTGYEEVEKDAVVGTVVNTDVRIGKLLLLLHSFKLIIYALTVLLFIFTFLIL